MTEELTNENNHKKRNRALLVFGITLLIGLVVGLLYIRYKKTHISTDDAFVTGAIHQIAPRISGTVLEILVRDNQFVKKGDLLARLDPEPYEKKRDEAYAAFEAEKKQLNELEAAIHAQGLKVEAARARLEKALSGKDELIALLQARRAEFRAEESFLRQAETDLRRAEGLLKKGVFPQDRYDRAKTARDAARAKLDALKAAVKRAEAALSGHKSTIKEAEAGLSAEEAFLNRIRASLQAKESILKRRKAALEYAELQLSYTRITAPAGGYITKKSIEAGDQVRAGMPLMAVVPLSGLYVVANYKETQIAKIKPGQPVEIDVDAYPGRTFEGRVESIMAGTGAVFSLFPPENATGNYVKVVQRIPVKIVLKEDTDPEHILRVGMSVVPTVLAR